MYNNTVIAPHLKKHLVNFRIHAIQEMEVGKKKVLDAEICYSTYNQSSDNNSAQWV